ncbi:MAG TPA: S8 family serine peptidase [Chloroflexia bacterium]|nr:S8 family serine peptidase [Chloroflexia bacterium]
MKPGTGVKIASQIASRILAAVAFALAICVALIGSGGGASAGLPTGIATADQASKIEVAVLKDTADGKSASVMVLLADQADVSAGYGMKDQDARGWYVYNTLTQHAERTQAALRATLDAQGIQYRSFWAANAIEMTVDRSLLETLAARSDVGKIESNKPTRWIEDPELANLRPADESPDVIEWGVNNVNAPQVWAMGYTGQGIVIGNQDTGMRWTHNALKPKYRGWNGATADHNYNWHDSIHTGGGSCGPNSVVPCDDYGHGTHTTGTTVGDDGAGNQVGVAPGAKWIGCRNMNVGAGTPASYTECFEFFIAPTDLAGNNPNPSLRPHVMNNSWGCPTVEGCAPTTLQTIVENTQAQGIFVEASNGNDGSSCSSVNASGPPAIYEAAFSTGAINISNALANFSSRGPVTSDGSNRMKPNISAPGVNVRSSTRTSDTSYDVSDGTSMAGPHVVGVVALLWSARPQLVRDIATTKTILQNTANPNVTAPAQTCGGIPSSQIPNNSFGYGRVDALAAVNSVAQGTPTPTGTTVPATPTAVPPTSTRTATRTATIMPPSATVVLPSATATCVPSGAMALVSIVDFAFSPQNLTVSAGTTVRWTNNGEATHNSTSFKAVWASPNLSTGQTFDYTFNTPGSYPYGCTLHSGMEGTITVQAAVPCATGTVVAPTSTRTATSVAATSTSGPPPPSATRTRTSTVVPTSTFGPPPPTVTPGGPTSTSTVEVTVEPTSTPCTVTFTDVPPDSTFYTWIRCLACRGIISGYSDGTFKPGNDITRGQIAKAVSNAAGFDEDPGTQLYEDVPPDSPFYAWINRLSMRGHMGGYPCGLVPEETCIPPDNRPYFRPNASATRGQLAKIVSNAAGLGGDPTGIFYTDVPEDHTFYSWIMRLTSLGVMSGYPCGTIPEEPCDEESRPYFRPFNNVTRGQASKIVANTFFPNCETPGRP